MALTIRIGENEKPLTEGEELNIVTVFTGQISIDFYLIDTQNNKREYYRVISDEIKTEAESFTRIKFQNVSDVQRVKVSNNRNNIKKIPDINIFFNDLSKNAQSDQKNYWTILGLSETIPEIDSVNKAARAMKNLYHDQVEIQGIINDAVRKIENFLKDMGYITVSLDVSGSEVFIDSKKVSELGKSVSISSGQHAINIKKDGKDIGFIGVEIKPGEKKNIAVPINPKGSIFEGGLTKSIQNFNISSVFILIFTIIMAFFFWPSYSGQRITEGWVITFSIMAFILLYLISNGKKVGIVLIMGYFLMYVFEGGFTTIVSLLVLIWAGHFYLNEGKNWQWI